MKTRPSTLTNLGSPGGSASSSNINTGQSSSSGIPSSSSGLSTSTSSTGQNVNTTDSGVSATTPAQLPPSTLPLNTQQLLLMVSERQARVVALPSQQMIGKCILSSNTSAVRADVVYMKTIDAHCLYVYFTSGQVCIYALPSLRIIKELELEPLSSDFQIESNVNFNLDGHLVHFSSTELTKYCANSALHETLLALKPTLAKDIEIPEPPKQG
jgi:syntaxin-binding protein 5